MKQVSRNDDGRAGERGNGIHLGAKDHRDSLDEDIAHHAAADARQHAEQDGSERVNDIRERLLRAGHCENAEPGRIEKEYDMLDSLDVRVPKKRRDTRDQGYRDISPVTDCCRRHGPEQHISNHPACVPRYERKDAHPEHVEPALHPSGRAADGKHERPHEVERQK